ncbi:hypothetical protein GDO86_019334, partial [Hymenochirus boettgeri]
MGSAAMLLLTGILFAGVSWAQREVTIQKGPLYRTAGSHMSMWCSVRGYKGPSQQNFLWSIYLPSAPEKEIQIVSTEDTSFSYAIYLPRVRSGDIYVERVSGDRALLHIRQLQEQDAGEYECHTPNTDPSYHGSYSAKMNLAVIPDTLVVSLAPQSLHKVEGSSLQVTCDVSQNSSQHTHLSVTWYRLSGELADDVISLTQNFSVWAGPSYSQRHSVGDVRMDKLGDSTFRLTLYNLQTSDQGEFYCQGTEWIQDPDGSWFAMTQKRSEGTSVTVQPTGTSLTVTVTSNSSSVLEGVAISLACSVASLSGPQSRISTSWYLQDKQGRQREVVRQDRDGVIWAGDMYRERQVSGGLRAVRSGTDTFSLELENSQRTDEGSYECRVAEWVLAPDGEWHVLGERSAQTSVDIVAL